MHNRLIFRYHCERAKTQPMLLRGCWEPVERHPEDPTHIGAVSNAGTQEGR